MEEDFHTIEERMERLYDEGRQLFMRGKYDEAVEPFKRIYEVSLVYRDAVEIVDDYYSKERDEWIAKYKARFAAGPNGR